MTRFYGIIISYLFLVGCKKENATFIYGTVKMKGCDPTAWVVILDQPDASKYRFLCPPYTGSESGYNCSNSVAILNMPASLAQPNKRIKFSKWEDKGLLCLSSSYGTHHLASTDVQAE